MERIIEIKCPFNPAVHIEHCHWNTPEDLKKGNPTYFCQVQTNMIVTGTELCDFISFSPLFEPPVNLHILEVPYDKEYCDILMERIELAVEYIKNEIKKLIP